MATNSSSGPTTGFLIRHGLDKNSTVDAVVALLIFVAGLVVIYGSLKLGASWGDDGPGAGYFPFYIGALLCISGIGVFSQTMLTKIREAEKDTAKFVDLEALKRVLSVLVPAIVYVGAIQLIGIYIASAVYIALFMVYLGHYGWIKSVLLGLAVNVAFFLMFEVWFKVPLYKGSYDPLAFLGY
jgi:hypothetical protein